MPPLPNIVEVSSMTAFTSEIDAVVAFRRRRVMPDRSAIMFAAVVLPVPGGPKKIMFEMCPDSTMRRRIPFLPTNFSCPTISSKSVGRTRSASG